MGATTSRRISKEERKDRDRRRQQKIQDNVERNARSITPDAPVTSVERYRQLREKEIGHFQLLRGDRSFTKTDLVAILVRLRQSHPSHQSHPPDPIDVYHALTIKDLIVLIREELYSPATPALPRPTDLVVSRK